MNKILSKFGGLLPRLLLLAALLALPAPQPVQASIEYTEFTVNSTSDSDDFVINSVCDATTLFDMNDICTLRAALTEANWCDNAPGACGDYVIIHLPAGRYTISLPGRNENQNHTGDLDITSVTVPIIIEGAGVGQTIIDANSLDRVLQTFYPNTSVTLRDLTLRNGRLEQTSGTPGQSGGGISHGGGSLFLENMVIENNTIVCLPEVDPSQCYQGTGGGIFAYGQLQIVTSIVRDNQAYRGGGIFYNGPTDLQIFFSTFSGNQAISGGALIAWGPVYMFNSTVSGNTATNIGGLYNSQGSMRLVNVTIAANIAANYSAANLMNAGSAATMTIKNSIVAIPLGGNLVNNCQNSTGTWISAGYNLSSDSSCQFTTTGDQQNTLPKLTPLAFLGGATPTHGLLSASPARNAGPTRCRSLDGFDVTIDQRGENRDTQCDFGAFEGLVYPVYLPSVSR